MKIKWEATFIEVAGINESLSANIIASRVMRLCFLINYSLSEMSEYQTFGIFAMFRKYIFAWGKNVVADNIHRCYRISIFCI